MAEITAKELIAHATFLASDELGGRLTGSPGQERAAKYIAEQFAALGLEPLGDEVDGVRGWQQRYAIGRTFLTDGSKLVLDKDAITTGFCVLGRKPMVAAVDGTLQYVGRGRTRGTEAEVAADADLSKVIPVVVLRTPRGTPGRRLDVMQKFSMSFQALGGVGRTAQALGKQGAKAVLFLLVDDPTGVVDVLNYLAVAPGKDLLAPRFKGGEDSMGGMAQALGDTGGVTTLVLAPALSARVLAACGVDSKDVLQWLAGEHEPPQSKTQPQGGVHLELKQDEQATACNVVACLRGSDPKLAAEAVVFSAHMDHVGRRMDGEVFNGADDNASGSSGLLGIAKAFAKGKDKPRRSIVFLSVSGEELGLWGSSYYSDNPTWPQEQIVADVNTDMIGRSGPESKPMEVTITPSHEHRMFSTIVQDAARFATTMGIGLQSGDKYYERSDHYNFAKKGIPVVFFCNGEHEDYHQVTDHADKLDPNKMERLARLAFWTGWTVANADDKPRTLGPQPDWK